jgi:hypothetical protein
MGALKVLDVPAPGMHRRSAFGLLGLFRRRAATMPLADPGPLGAAGF